MGSYYDEAGFYHEVETDNPLDREKPNYWRGSSTKKGANPKSIAKRRRKNKIGRKAKQKSHR